MGTSATAAKYRYNTKNYKRFEVLIKPPLYEQIKTYCEAAGLSRAQFLQLAVDTLARQHTEK